MESPLTVDVLNSKFYQIRWRQDVLEEVSAVGTLKEILRPLEALGAKRAGLNYRLKDLQACITAVVANYHDLKGNINKDVYLDYSRRWCIATAYLVFIGVEVKSIVLWNAMIASFSRYACVNEAMILFEKMLQSGICPNEVTNISMLFTCNHVGLVESGRYYFDQMMQAENMQANVLHYSCMVVVLRRSGLIYVARGLIENMPF
ncbi:hypothetical protein J5N97_006430 [Dioscorea zingiberensis]|uniref:Pentatricopeptide repeat-containing protein n=1 Tax=Dioscorea zingiberensis TaxID=325984 RepID=A0A9D5DBE5_9LILI|nr:hypothetical protein J5N97_006430 [Dioscorea zingiberensis]